MDVFLGTAFLATLPAMELRRGVVETIGISAVESVKTIELIEAHCVELRFKFGDGMGIGVDDT